MVPAIIQEGKENTVSAAAASNMSQLDEFDGLDDIEAQIAALDEVSCLSPSLGQC